MILYRSIGDTELKQLLNQQIINGMYNCKDELQNSNDAKNIVCFFVDEIIWLDSNHKFVISVDIPTEDLMFGTATYYASDNLRKTKIWTGRNGSKQYQIREAYINSYSIKQVKEIYLLGHYANHHVQGYIMPICNKYHIACYHTGLPFENSQQIFIKDRFSYKTKDNTDDWIDSLKIDENKYIQNVKNKVSSAQLTIEQARRIKSILQQI